LADLGECSKLADGEVDLVLAHVVAEIDGDLHALLDGGEGELEVVGGEAEQPDHAQRQPDHGGGQPRQDRGPAEGGEGFAKRVHGPLAAAESYTSAPASSSSSRACGYRPTTDRSCVAMTTAMPEALMLQNRSMIPRVARSSR